MTTDGNPGVPPYTESVALLDQPNGTGGIWFDAEQSLRKAQLALTSASCNTTGSLKDGIRNAKNAGMQFETMLKAPNDVAANTKRASEMLAWSVYFMENLERKLHVCARAIEVPQDPTKTSTEAPLATMSAEDSAIRQKIIGCIVKRECGSLRGFDQYAGGEAYRSLFKDLTIIPFVYRQFQNRAGSSVILFGPPGSGKSALAEAVAADVNGSFISISAADLKGKYVGESEKSVKMLFEVARELTKRPDGKTAPVVIFVDEIEGVISNLSAGSETSTGILSELNKQLQGVGSSNAGIITMVATNFPERIPASAISRFGDARLYVGLPTLEALEEYFYMLFAQMPDTFKTGPGFLKGYLYQPGLESKDGRPPSRPYDSKHSVFRCPMAEQTSLNLYWNVKIEQMFNAMNDGTTEGFDTAIAILRTDVKSLNVNKSLFESLARTMKLDASTGVEQLQATLERLANNEAFVQWEQVHVSVASAIIVLAIYAWAHSWSLRDVATYWQVLKRTCARDAADFSAMDVADDWYRYFVLDKSSVVKKKDVNGRCESYYERRNTLTPMGFYTLNEEQSQFVEVDSHGYESYLGTPDLTLAEEDKGAERIGIMAQKKNGATTYKASRMHVSKKSWRIEKQTMTLDIPEMLGHAPATSARIFKSLLEVKPAPIEGITGLIRFMRNSGRLLTPGETTSMAIYRLEEAQRAMEPSKHNTSGGSSTNQQSSTPLVKPSPTSTEASILSSLKSNTTAPSNSAPISEQEIDSLFKKPPDQGKPNQPTSQPTPGEPPQFSSLNTLLSHDAKTANSGSNTLYPKIETSDV